MRVRWGEMCLGGYQTETGSDVFLKMHGLKNATPEVEATGSEIKATTPSMKNRRDVFSTVVHIFL